MKFECSHCGQHLEADTIAAGAPTTCPSCEGDLTVPQTASMSSMIRLLLLVVLLMAVGGFAVSECAAANYFIDSVTGNDGNSGRAADAAWKSHTKVEDVKLRPGDTVGFARGSAWEGGLHIKASGAEGKPILFTNCGSGALPRFSNPDWSDNTGNAIRLDGDYLIADGLYFHNVPPPPGGWFTTVWSAGALRIMKGADHSVVRNCHFEKVPKAIQSHGEHTLITRNTMTGKQVLLGSKYWGPIAIQLGIGNQV